MINVIDAIEFAVSAHASQVRKGTDKPYLLHPIGVARILINNNCPEDCIIAGILHDVMEDAKVSYEELCDKFGTKVANIVKGVSEPDKSAPWEVRKQHTIDFIKTASDEIRMVSCADKLDNLRTTAKDYNVEGEKLWDRFRAGKEKQLWYYNALVGAFKIKRYEYPMFRDYELLVSAFTDMVNSKKASGEGYSIKSLVLEDEIGKFIDPSSLPKNGQPKFVLLMGGPGAGKTTIRKQKYSKGYVLIDASEIFNNLGGTKYHEFGTDMAEPMELIGSFVASRAIKEKRNIVTEMIGDKVDDMETIINTMKSCGYIVELCHITCDPKEAYVRNLNKDYEDISAYYTQKYHQKWISEAAKQNRNKGHNENHL